MHRKPTSIENLESWKTHRRKFLKAAVLAGITTQVSFISSCSNITEDGNELLNGEQITLLKKVLEVLWPNDGNGPGIEELNTLNYFFWVLNDEYKAQSSNNLIIEGIDWAKAEGLAKFDTNPIDMQPSIFNQFIAEIAEDKYGKKWLDVLLTYIFESLILDPIYGAQPNNVGWEWLNHTPGYPQPSEENRYEELLKIKQNEI